MRQCALITRPAAKLLGALLKRFPVVLSKTKEARSAAGFCQDRQHQTFVQRLREVAYVQSKAGRGPFSEFVFWSIETMRRTRGKVRYVERQAALLEEEVNARGLDWGGVCHMLASKPTPDCRRQFCCFSDPLIPSWACGNPSRTCRLLRLTHPTVVPLVQVWQFATSCDFRAMTPQSRSLRHSPTTLSS